jgi:hypothetical protein
LRQRLSAVWRLVSTVRSGAGDEGDEEDDDGVQGLADGGKEDTVREGRSAQTSR